MMQPFGSLLYYGILLMSSITSAAAQTEDCDPGLSFTEIAWDNIGLAWDKPSFNDATLYRIDRIGDKTCTKDNYDCKDRPCQIDTSAFNCYPIPKPCSAITYYVTGYTDSGNISKSLSTTIAPKFKESDWKLSNSERNDSTIIARWGPPDSSSGVSCAITAQLEASCLDDGNLTVVNSTLVTLTNSDEQGVETIMINSCIQENVTLTVTYMAEVTYMSDELNCVLNEPTETKNDITLFYEDTTTFPGSTTASVSPKDDHLSGGEIAGIVIGVVVGVCLIAGAIFLMYKKKWLCFE